MIYIKKTSLSDEKISLNICRIDELYNIINKIVDKHNISIVADIENLLAVLDLLRSELNFQSNDLLGTLINYNSDIINISNFVSEFGKIMAPFYFAVSNWKVHLTNYKNKLINDNKLESGKIVNDNILDEDGYIPVKYTSTYNRDPDKCHTATFIKFLHSLGYYGKLSISKSVELFNNSLEILLNNESLAYNACVYGAIEYFYIEISDIISNFCSKNNIQQEHYNKHKILDTKHSMDFFKVANQCNATSGDLIKGIIIGYLLIDHVFNNLSIEPIKCLTNLTADKYQDYIDIDDYYDVSGNDPCDYKPY